MRNHFKALLSQVFQRFCMGLKFSSRRRLNIKYPDIQAARGRHLWIQLPQRARRRISGIGKKLLAFQLLFFVEPFETSFGHKDLAPDDQAGQGLRKTQRDGGDGLEVFRHILPDPAVSTGGAPDKDAVFILQGHGKAVHFGLYVVLHVRIQGVAHPLIKFLQLFCREDVLKAL